MTTPAPVSVIADIVWIIAALIAGGGAIGTLWANEWRWIASGLVAAFIVLIIGALIARIGETRERQRSAAAESEPA